MRARLLVLTGSVWLGFQIFLLWRPQSPLLERPVHLALALLVLFLSRPLQAGWLPRWTRSLADPLLLVGVLATLIFYSLEWERLTGRMEGVDRIGTVDLLAGGFLLLALLEGVRRVVGWILLSVILLALVFSSIGQWYPGWSELRWLPEMFRHGGIPFEEWMEILVLTPNGILGLTTSTSVGLVFYFVCFGVFYSAIGGGRYFIDIGLWLGGGRAGGAAKAAIVSSSLMGSISGSAVANASTTGIFTIPLMRRTGYSPWQAAGIEAIASTGGQLMPPIMGISAFVMAEQLNMSYTRIALAGIIPALGFYLSLFLLVDLGARKRFRESRADASTRRPFPLSRSHLLLPPALLVAMLIGGLSPGLSAVIGAASCVVLSLLTERLSLSGWAGTVAGVARQAAGVAIPIAAIGVVMEVAVQSNLALKFSHAVVSRGEEHTLLSLLLIVLGCLVMGTGLPTVASYIIGKILFVPLLVEMGAPELGANFFVMYFCVLSMVTPPVAMVSYTTANLARAGAIRTGLHAFRLSWVAFLVPFSFLFDPALLGEGTLPQILTSLLFLLAAVIGWAVGLEGHLRRPLDPWHRWLVAAVSLLIFGAPVLAVTPDRSLWLRLVGSVLLVLLLVPCAGGRAASPRC